MKLLVQGVLLQVRKDGDAPAQEGLAVFGADRRRRIGPSGARVVSALNQGRVPPSEPLAPPPCPAVPGTRGSKAALLLPPAAGRRLAVTGLGANRHPPLPPPRPIRGGSKAWRRQV